MKDRLRLGVKCPKCGRRPALRIHPALKRAARIMGDPDMELMTVQCPAPCGEVYSVTGKAFRNAAA